MISYQYNSIIYALSRLLWHFYRAFNLAFYLTCYRAFLWHSFGTLSGMCYCFCSDMSSGIASGMLSATYYDILFGILSRIRSGILSGFLLWHPIYLYLAYFLTVYLAIYLTHIPRTQFWRFIWHSVRVWWGVEIWRACQRIRAQKGPRRKAQSRCLVKI